VDIAVILAAACLLTTLPFIARVWRAARGMRVTVFRAAPFLWRRATANCFRTAHRAPFCAHTARTYFLAAAHVFCRSPRAYRSLCAPSRTLYAYRATSVLPRAPVPARWWVTVRCSLVVIQTGGGLVRLPVVSRAALAATALAPRHHRLPLPAPLRYPRCPGRFCFLLRVAWVTW